MTAFERAWSLLKTPIWHQGDLDDPESELPQDDPERFPRVMSEPIARLNPDTGRIWESGEEDARGHAQIQWDDDEVPYHQITDFEMATDARGEGLSRDRLREFIDELKEEDEWLWDMVDEEFQDAPDETHVVQVESDTADYWNKLVEEGMLTSASPYPHVRRTPEGELIPLIEDSPFWGVRT